MRLLSSLLLVQMLLLLLCLMRLQVASTLRVRLVLLSFMQVGTGECRGGRFSALRVLVQLLLSWLLVQLLLLLLCLMRLQVVSEVRVRLLLLPLMRVGTGMCKAFVLARCECVCSCCCRCVMCECGYWKKYAGASELRVFFAASASVRVNFECEFECERNMRHEQKQQQ